MYCSSESGQKDSAVTEKKQDQSTLEEKQSVFLPLSFLSFSHEAELFLISCSSVPSGLTSLPSVGAGKGRGKVNCPIITSLEQCVPSTILTGYVRSSGSNGLFITVGYNVTGNKQIWQKYNKFISS